VILSLDADLLAGLPGHLRHTRAFGDGRAPGRSMNRLYVVETDVSTTGANADHRLALRSGDILPLAAALLTEVLERVQRSARLPEEARALLAALPRRVPDSVDRRWLAAVAGDLLGHSGAALVVSGPRQPPLLHGLVAALNEVLGATRTGGDTAAAPLRYRTPVLSDLGGGPDDLQHLAREIRAGQVRLLVITAFDPVHTAPADLPFGRLLRRVPRSLYLGLHHDATAERCRWVLPARHPFEGWCDAATDDGTVSLVQPLIRPLFGGTSRVELLAACAGQPGIDERVLLETTWRDRLRTPAGAAFEETWRTCLQQGVIAGVDDQAEAAEPRLDWAALAARVHDLAAAAPAAPAAGGAASLELDVHLDIRLLDGRHATNPWLLETPDPVTQLTWENAAHLCPATARRLGVASGDVLELRLEGRAVRVPALVVPGHALDAISITVGHGRTIAGAPASHGVDAGRLRTVHHPWFAPGLTVRRTGEHRTLALAQRDPSQHGRPLALETTLDGLPVAVEQAAHLRGPQPSLYGPAPSLPSQGYQWGMAIDLNRCTGCSACVVACQAENNIPTVGREEVVRGRRMHWLRVDRYVDHPDDDPRVIAQPVMCVHCENAPCEYVCPVNATVHSSEGLNEMVYNRCIGTRYCSNNCPYKVRHFNYYGHGSVKPEVHKLAMNPEVTVRPRGVMEKCTYCVQRIERARIEARSAGREIADGDVTTACQQTCPAAAITFGSYHRPDTRVARLRGDPRSYQLLHELGTRPRTVHLVRVRNPNRELL
jgi:molybdopterin-containing oxidoreductase family iron-sulfur binding subunit